MTAARTSERFVPAGGVRLRVVEAGPPDAAPVLVLHGFTGCAEAMEGAARELAAWRTLRVDLVGHGASDAPRDAEAYTMPRCVAQLTALLDALVPRAASHVVGYSLGGRAALHLAAAHPERVRSLVLVGASPGLADPAERAARRRADEALADAILRDGVEAFVERWTALPLFATQRRLPPAVRARERALRLRARAHGLALSLRGMGTGAQEPLHARLASLRVPACLVVGSEDAKFRAIADAMAARLPRAERALIEEAGHAAHLEQPAAFGRAARAFLRAVESPAARPDPSHHGHREPREGVPL